MEYKKKNQQTDPTKNRTEDQYSKPANEGRGGRGGRGGDNYRGRGGRGNNDNRISTENRE